MSTNLGWNPTAGALRSGQLKVYVSAKLCRPSLKFQIELNDHVADV